MAGDIQQVVKEKYGEAALRARNAAKSSCCGTSDSCGVDGDPVTSNLYAESETSVVPEQAVRASLGRDNQQKAGVTNVEFLKGEIERIPLPDNSVDVIISNCVINLSADKDRVLREAFRVLKPGGRFAVSDVVVRGEVPSDVRRSMLLWVGCIAGALQDSEYAARLAAAGFEAISIEPTRVYSIEDARAFLSNAGIDVDTIAPQVEGKFMSAFVRARKPSAASAA